MSSPVMVMSLMVMVFSRSQRNMNSYIKLAMILIVEFSKVTLCDRHSFIQGPRDFIVALEEITKVIIFHPNSLITIFFFAIHRLSDFHVSPSRFSVWTSVACASCFYSALR